MNGGEQLSMKEALEQIHKEATELLDREDVKKLPEEARKKLQLIADLAGNG